MKLMTIDGTSGVGKGTLSFRLANTLQWAYLDSGAIYRVLALSIQRTGSFKDIIPIKAYETETDALDQESMRRSSVEVQRKDHFKPVFEHRPIPGLNEVKAYETETDAVDKESMRRSSVEVQRKDHFKHGIGIARAVSCALALDLKFSTQQGKGSRVWLSGEDVTTEIRTETCGQAASHWAAYPEIRSALLQRQRDFLTDQGLVADGRDMGTVVFPEAPLKLFLFATPQVRATRRWNQLHEQGIDVSMSRLLDEIVARDHRDENRSCSPLVPAQDAIIIDTSALSADQVFERALVEVNRVFGGLPR